MNELRWRVVWHDEGERVEVTRSNGQPLDELTARRLAREAHEEGRRPVRVEFKASGQPRWQPSNL